MPDAPGPLPGDLILHTCNGRARWWVASGDKGTCVICEAPVAGDLPYREGHASVYCGHCRRRIGVCSGEQLEQVAEGARRVLSAEGRNNRRAKGDA